jgi:hypothetical protein
MDSCVSTTKTVILENTNPKTTKKINCEKEKKMRVETKTWGLTDGELEHDCQLNALQLYTLEKKDLNEYNNYVYTCLSHIRCKLSGYKQQDILKKKLDQTRFVSFNEVISLLHECGMKCHYCSQDVYVLYERVREMKQWSLDRIDNNVGHNSGNLVVACLECNLKRRRTNKDAFMFTKNLVITREGL